MQAKENAAGSFRPHKNAFRYSKGADLQFIVLA